jgi:hypothetical protein
MTLRYTKVMTSFLMLALAACSESSKTTPAKRQIQPADDADQSADQNNKNDLNNAPLDCEGQWALALRQQPQGSAFTYSSKAYVAIVTYPFSRSVKIANTTPESLSQIISIDDSYVSGLIGGAGQQNITLQKSQFIQACQTEVPQPLAISTLVGQLVVKSKTSQVLAIQGQSIPVDVIVMDLTNVSYGGLTVSGEVTVYMSSRYPALPIKQTLSITNSSESLLNGARLEDTLESPLPSVN